jgi:hypothetical protein
MLVRLDVLDNQMVWVRKSQVGLGKIDHIHNLKEVNDSLALI